MTERISLVEAYNNRDVIAQLVRLRDNVDELMNILKDIDPNGDLTNVVTKTGDQTIDGVKTFIGQIVADCDIIQNGAAYETHAEQVFSVNDYIVTRDGQITGLSAGDLSGFHVKKYNGVDDSRLGVDNTGTMRVGDVGQEQPLATRDEAADMVSGAYVRWDGVNQKLIAPDVDTGDDTHPVKFVDGAPVAVLNKVLTEKTNATSDDITSIFTSAGITVNSVKRYVIGPLVFFEFLSLNITSGMNAQVSGAFPTGYTPLTEGRVSMSIVNNGTYIGELYVYNGKIYIQQMNTTGTFYGQTCVVCSIA